MANTRVYEWSTTAASNTDINSNNIAEGCAPSGINNAIRELMRQVRIEVANQGSDIASAGTTDIGAATGQYVKVTGTTTITSFGTVNAGTSRWVEFTGTLTLTHNATSLKLPGSANITTANGDVACFVSLGSGNWKCLGYWAVSGSPIALNITSSSAGTIGTITSTDAGASVGPVLDLFRDSASPAANDVIGAFAFTGKDSGGGTDTYGRIIAAIVDQTAASEDGQFVLQTAQAGTLTNCAIFEAGLRMGGAPAGGDKGLGTINSKGLYVEGHGTVAQVVADTELTLVTSATTMPFDDTIPQNTEGVEVLSVAITPINASSTLEIDVSTQVGSSTTTTVTAALFVDSTADAINAMGESVDATTIRTIKYIHRVTAGSTSARTYKVRVGGNAGTVSLNGINGASRRYGGVCTSTLTVREILPQ